LTQNYLLKSKKPAIMLTQFRKRYPHGSIISKLLKIDRGKYIVKASVQVEGVTLATGMAAADTIESAEDSAINRALALLEPLETSIVPETPEIQPQKATAPKPKETAKATVKATVKAQKKEVEINQPSFNPSPLPETPSFTTPTSQPELTNNNNVVYEPEPLVLNSDEQAIDPEPLYEPSFAQEQEQQDIATSYKISPSDAASPPAGAHVLKRDLRQGISSFT
jgi:hypothetical protein